MFNHVSIWQMVVDVCLITSILVMAFRYAKSSRAHLLLPRIVELEGRVAVLLAEAEGRAKHISDQLSRREQQLTRYLSDIEKREKDVSLALGEGDALTQELSLLCEGARREALELERALAEARAARSEQRSSHRPDQDRGVPYERARGLDSRDWEADRAESKKQSMRAERQREHVHTEYSAGTESNRSNAESSRSSAQNLRDTYHAAEEMLKQGRGAEEVSKQTSLPIDGVKRLAQMIEIEREERDDDMERLAYRRKAADPRLGALGAARRSTTNA